MILKGPNGVILIPETPRAHWKHSDGVPCGCWEGEGDAVLCLCGVAYQPAEVAEFSNFRCYDCGARVFAFPLVTTGTQTQKERRENVNPAL